MTRQPSRRQGLISYADRPLSRGIGTAAAMGLPALPPTPPEGAIYIAELSSSAIAYEVDDAGAFLTTKAETA